MDSAGKDGTDPGSGRVQLLRVQMVVFPHACQSCRIKKRKETTEMPGFDGKGPDGRGPQSGRGMGRCRSGKAEEPGQGKGQGQGRKRGLRDGSGGGRGRAERTGPWQETLKRD